MRRIAVPVSVSGGMPRRPPAQHSKHVIHGESMGTTWMVQYFASPDHAEPVVYRQVCAELDRIVAQMSHWRADSDLSRFNDAPAGEWVALPSELLSVLQTSIAVTEETEGAFDASVGPLVDAWGFGPHMSLRTAPPLPLSFDQRPATDGVRLDVVTGRGLQPGGVRFDLSSIAKGYAVDRVAEILDVPGISSCLVEIGGELKSRGVKPDGQPWWVALESPATDAEIPETLIALCGSSIASSGDYRRFFEHEGVRYSHTLDPRTGRPVSSAFACVSVVHPKCMLADAYSTAIAVLGTEDGLAFANRTGIAAQMVLRNGGGYSVRHSRAFEEMLEM